MKMAGVLKAPAISLFWDLEPTESRQGEGLLQCQ